jgi:hypothetical protein
MTVLVECLKATAVALAAVAGSIIIVHPDF